MIVATKFVSSQCNKWHTLHVTQIVTMATTLLVYRGVGTGQGGWSLSFYGLNYSCLSSLPYMVIYYYIQQLYLLIDKYT